MEAPRWISKKIVEAAKSMGGIDVDDEEDLEELPSCDKGSHKLRSLFHAPQHGEHWKKEEVIVYEDSA